MNDPIMMTESVWMNSQFSIARHYGCCTINGKQYLILDKRGRDVWECSMESQRLGRDKAIPAGEPCDLVQKDFQTLYRKLGREKFMQIVIDHPLTSDNEIKRIMKECLKDKKEVNHV